METTPALQTFLALVAKYITKLERIRFFIYFIFLRPTVSNERNFLLFKKKKEILNFVSYIFRAGSNLVSSSIKRKYEKKEGTNPWIFFLFVRLLVLAFV
jgi:hypothetical protein